MLLGGWKKNKKNLQVKHVVVKVTERIQELTDTIKTLEFDNQAQKDKLEKCEKQLKNFR